MMRGGPLATFIGFAALAATAASAAVKTAPSELNQAVAFPSGILSDRDLVYATIEGFRPLTLDIYRMPPKPKQTARPAIVFVHGGGWATGDARHVAGFDEFPATFAALAAKGYVVASVNYRLAGEAHYPAAVQDVKAAVRWLRGHAADYDIDTTRVMAWGVEAGGHIAALVGTSCGVATLEPLADAKSRAPMASDCVQGVIDWYGPTDLASWDTGQTSAPGAPTRLGAYLGCEAADCAPGIVHAASPLSYIGSTSPPFLIQQGADDTFVAPAQSRKLYEALQAQHVPSELVIYPDVGRDFAKDGAPDTTVHAKAIADLEDFVAKTFPTAKPGANSPDGPTQAANLAKPRATRPAAKLSPPK